MRKVGKENIGIEKVKNIVLVIGFMILLVFPSVQGYFPIVPILEFKENRQLASKPMISFNNRDKIPVLYEEYYNDHFSLRNQLVRLKSLIIAKTLHKSPMPDQVIFGKDNWLYLVKDELDTYRGKNLLEQADLEKISNEMKRRKAYLDHKNIRLYFVIVPTKYTIYPEYLPGYIDKLSTITNTDLVKNVLLKSGVDVLDLRDTLINLKGDDLLFYKTDNHWNDLGSFYASKTILDRIKIDFPHLLAPKRDDFIIKKEIIAGRNAARLINMEDQFEDINYILDQKSTSPATMINKSGYPVPQYFPYPWEYEMVYEVENDSLPKILLIRDSFGTSIIPFMNQSFSKSVFLFDNWNYTSNEDIIENEEPDIVLYLVLESLWHGFITGIDVSQK